MWAVVAGALAGVLAYLELQACKRRPLAWRASHWIAMRLGADAAAGFLAYGLVRLAFGQLAWMTPSWSALLAGLVGPAILRSQLSLLGAGDETVVGPATAFRRLQGQADRNIDDIGAAAQAKWMFTEAVPVCSPPDGFRVLVDRSITYVNGLERLNDTERTQACVYIAQVRDDTAAQGEKAVAIAQHLIDLGGQRFVRSFVKERRRRSRGR